MTIGHKPELSLESLDERHTGITVLLAGTLFEAASVCLNRHHSSPAEVEITCRNGTTTRWASFLTPGDRVLNAWANEIDTTELGAYCVCLAAVESEEELVAVKRAETLSGADWYVAPIGASVHDLERCLRLEVSGLDTGSRAMIEARLRQKVEQTRRGASNLPAIATVVGFEKKVVAIQRVSEGE